MQCRKARPSRSVAAMASAVVAVSGTAQVSAEVEAGAVAMAAVATTTAAPAAMVIEALQPMAIAVATMVAMPMGIAPRLAAAKRAARAIKTMTGMAIAGRVSGIRTVAMSAMVRPISVAVVSEEPAGGGAVPARAIAPRLTNGRLAADPRIRQRRLSPLLATACLPWPRQSHGVSG